MKDKGTEYFVCPHCKKTMVCDEGLAAEFQSGTKYCGHCGEDIATALAETVAKEAKDQVLR